MKVKKEEEALAARMKRGGRTSGRYVLTGISVSSELRERVDAWAAKQSDKPTRPEAILRLVELGLETTHRRGVPCEQGRESIRIGGSCDRPSYLIRHQPMKNANFARKG